MNARNAVAGITLVALCVASFGTLASGPFAVSAKLSHQGKVFAEPSAVVRNGEPASIEVSGSGGYKLALTVSELAADKIQVVANVESPHGSIAPTVVVRPGVPASITIGEVGLTLTVNRSGS